MRAIPGLLRFRDRIMKFPVLKITSSKNSKHKQIREPRFFMNKNKIRGNMCF